jgi:uncharacterized protein HemY
MRPTTAAGAHEGDVGAWTTAAAAMREHDYGRAELAFDELARSPDSRTRDAGRLARAQLFIAQGRFAAARAELADLAERGATSLVRERSAQALRGLP